MEWDLGFESDNIQSARLAELEAASAQGQSLANSKENRPGEVEHCVEFALPRGGRKC